MKENTKIKGSLNGFKEKASNFANKISNKFIEVFSWYPLVRKICLLLTLLTPIAFVLEFIFEDKGSFLTALEEIMLVTGYISAIVSGPWKYIKVFLVSAITGLMYGIPLLLIPVIGWVLGPIIIALGIGLPVIVFALCPTVSALYCFFKEGGFTNWTGAPKF